MKFKLFAFSFAFVILSCSIIAQKTLFSPIEVDIVPAQKAAVTETVIAHGSIVKGLTFSQYADTDFDVKSVKVAVGDYIKKGDLIFITSTDKKVYSKYSGTISEICPENQKVFEGQNIISLIDCDSLLAVVNVNELDSLKIQKGQSVELTGTAFNEKCYKGEIISIGAEAIAISNATICLPVTVKIINPDKDLKPKFSIKAKINVSTNDVVSIPKEAVIDDSYVYVISNSIATKRSVKCKVDTDVVYVTRGLNVGEKVVLNPKNLNNAKQVSVTIK